MRIVFVALLAGLTVVTSACTSGSPGTRVTVTESATPTTSTAEAPTPSPAPSSLVEARHLAEPAVARVTVTSWETGVPNVDTGQYEDRCSVFVGTAFAVDPSLLVTAAHVVEASDRIRVTLGEITTPADVVGYDRNKDVALIRIQRSAPASLAFAKRPARVGDQVATLGYAEGHGLSYLAGDVNRVNTKEDVEGNFMTGLTEVDFAAKGGNSGGPVFDTSGDVVGIHVAGPGGGAGGRMVVPASTAAPLVDAWRAEPDSSALEPTECPLLPGEAVEAGSSIDEGYPASVHSAALTLFTYLLGVNSGDYKTAFAQLAHPGDYDAFVDGVDSSRIMTWQFAVKESANSPVLDLDFDSTQDEGDGPEGRPDEECTTWHLRYTFASRDGIRLIDKVRAQPGGPSNEPCFEGDAD